MLEGDVMDVHVAHFHGCKQGCAAVPVFGVDIGAALDEEAGHVGVIVADRHEERRDVVLVGFVHVCAGVQQQARRFDVAFARGVHQWRHVARNRGTQAVFGKSAANDPHAVRTTACSIDTGQSW